MASYSSDHIMLCTNERNEIADEWARLLAIDMRINEQGYTIHLLINGENTANYQFANYDNFETDETLEDFERDIIRDLRRIEFAVGKAMDRNKAAQAAKATEAARLATEKQIKVAQEAKTLKEAEDQKEYLRLKSKYEGSRREDD